jgi:formate dehydrogenase alpha subunit
VTGLATAFGSGAMTNSMDDIANAANIYFVIGSNTTEQHPVLGMRIRQAVKQRGAIVIVADPRRIPLVDFASLHLRHKPGTDVALLNGLMNVLITEDLYDKEFVANRTEAFDDLKTVVGKYTPEVVEGITGVPADDIRQAARLLAQHKPGSLLYAMGITQHTSGHNNVLSCANLQMLLGNMGVPGGGVNPLRGQSNVQGACDMGGLPNVFPGYQSVANADLRAKFEQAWGLPVGSLPAKPGLTVVEMMNAAHDGKIKALYVVGENPMMTDPDINHVREALNALDFLVVQDLFLTETGQLADVILPSTSFAEKSGTFTNTERRVQLGVQALQPIGEARPDWTVVRDLGKRMLEIGDLRLESGARFAGWEYTSSGQIMDEIAALTPSYGGISHARLGTQGLQWPCPNAEHPGTPILHVGKFSRGLGKFSAVEHIPPAELPDDEYPYLLTTGRILYHYHSGSLSRRAKALDAHVPEGAVEINPEDAARLDIANGELVHVASRRGEVWAKAQVTDRIEPGITFMTFHFREAAANLLTNPALDPVAKIPEFKACAVRLEKANGKH